ncbi:MAG: hypothetical protein EAZ55_06005 [Cytophagales bacterium]|nr:MAG: hypothetical protein EAZ55_06005 [Cytophagales bacterium]
MNTLTNTFLNLIQGLQTNTTTTQVFAPTHMGSELPQTRMSLSVYELQTISNALIAYARNLEKKEEQGMAKDARNLEKKIFQQFLALDTEENEII